jgi:hypothetical protein
MILLLDTMKDKLENYKKKKRNLNHLKTPPNQAGLIPECHRNKELPLAIQINLKLLKKIL